MKKPIILLTTSNVHSSRLEEVTGDTDLHYADRATAKVLIEAGGLPLYLPSLSRLQKEEIDQYLDLANGVLLAGADRNVNPLYYGETPTVMKGRVDDERDTVDIALIRGAYKRKLPLFGLCKGAQAINVALGGTLYQNIAAQHAKAFDHDMRKTDRSNFTHTVRLAKKSMLYSIFKKETISVNSAHEQAVKKLAPGLAITATAEDGIIEAYEAKRYPYLMGVQFHAELRSFDPQFFAIFQDFIKRCRA